MRWLDGITDSMDVNLSKFREIVKDRDAAQPPRGLEAPALPGTSHGQRSLAGYSPWGHKESDMTEQQSIA